MAWGWSSCSLKTYSAHAAGRHDPEGSSAHGRGTRCFAYPCLTACAAYNAHAAAQGFARHVGSENVFGPGPWSWCRTWFIIKAVSFQELSTSPRAPVTWCTDM